MDKKQIFLSLLKGEAPLERVFFRPILMHFAARFNKTTYGKFASDYRTLVDRISGQWSILILIW